MPNAGLGRGLGALIPNKNEPLQTGTSPKTGNDLSRNQTLKVPVKKISVNSHQPRQRFTDNKLDELVDSIKEFGIIQPLVVCRNKKGYELIAGERRLRAGKKAGLKEVPVIIRDVNEQEKMEVALIENIQREDLNPIELATAYHRLLDEFNITQTALAKRLGKARPSIANTMRMINLPEEIQLALIDGRISEGHAKYLVGLDSEQKQLNLFRKILHQNLNVADTDKASKHMGGTKAARIKINYKDKDKEFAFREFFGAKVEIKRRGQGGQIVMDFFTDDELDEMVEKIK